MPHENPFKSRQVAHLTRRSVDDVYTTMRDGHRLIGSSRDGGGERVGGVLPRAIEGAEVLGGSVLIGILAARLGTANIPGSSIPLGPVLGILGHAAALFNEEIGIPGSYVDHLHNVSNGFIGGWGALYGLGVGQGMREKAGLPPADVKVGGLPGSAPATVGCSTTMGCPSPQMGAAPPRVKRLNEVELASLYRRAP